jgi:hypothetical protein
MIASDALKHPDYCAGEDDAACVRGAFARTIVRRYVRLSRL